MGLFDMFRKKARQAQQSGPSSLPQEDLYQICYRMAYFMLPQILFSDTPRMLRYFAESEMPTGPFLYVMFCKMQQIEPVIEHARAFRAHSGQLSEGKTYHVLEYPAPEKDVMDLNLLDERTVLAPFFSAILHTRESGNVAYYVLGQRPMGGTTLRMVTEDGANANLGPGPQPELNAFLDVLRQRA